MDGLECTEVMISAVHCSTDYFRLEPEYFNAPSLSYGVTKTGREIIKGIQYGTSNACDEINDGYPVLRLNEIHHGFIETPQKYCHTLSKTEYQSLRLKKDDVLVIRTNGNPDLVGRAAVVMEDTEYAFASYLFRVFVGSDINPYTIVAFLSGKYGRVEIDKNSMKGNQTNFSPAKFCDVNFPILEISLQDEIKRLFECAYQKRNASISSYQQAESRLMSELAFSNVTNNSGNFSIKRMSESFGVSGRLDAEYYQPKYESIQRALNAKDTVRTLCKLHDRTFLPKPNEEYRYIELADVGTSGFIADVESQRGVDLPTRARRKVKRGQVIVSSVEGSLQSCALITDEYDNALCSTGFYVVDSAKINPETLLVLFKSEPMQALMKQRCSGTILTAISKDEFLSMPLPFIGDDVQIEIAQKVRESFSLRRQSEKLIETAVKAVEIAIEQDEAAAVEWLNTTTAYIIGESK